MGLIFWSHIFPQKSANPTFSVRRHAAACCSMLWHAAACFKTPTNRPQKQVLRHASTIGACSRAGRGGAPRAILKEKKGGWRNANRNERSRGRSLLHG